MRETVHKQRPYHVQLVVISTFIDILHKDARRKKLGDPDTAQEATADNEGISTMELNTARKSGTTAKTTRRQKPRESVTAPLKGQKKVERAKFENLMERMERLVEERQQKYMNILQSCEKYEDGAHGLNWGKPVGNDENVSGRTGAREEGD